ACALAAGAACAAWAAPAGGGRGARPPLLGAGGAAVAGLSAVKRLHKPTRHMHDSRQCHTAVYPEECFGSVEWAMTAGMAAHPEWYEGLNRSSAFEEFQQRVFWSNGSLCPEPCAPAPRSGGELFCFAVARMDDSDGADSSSADSEEGLLRAQLGRGAGIFACDDHAVLSDVDKVLGDLAAGPVRTVRIPSTKPDGITKDGTAQNTQIFLQAWETIRKDSRYLSFDWTVKVRGPAGPDLISEGGCLIDAASALEQGMFGIRSHAFFTLVQCLTTAVCEIGHAYALDVRTLRLEKDAQDPQGWSEIQGGQTCPSPRIAPTAAECEAMVKLTLAQGLFDAPTLRNPFEVNDATIPPGCSSTFSFTSFTREFVFNTHPTGSASPQYGVVCKSDDWQIYKSSCPAGLGPTTPEDCEDFVGAYSQNYQYDDTAFSDANFPPGCVGYGGSILSRRGTFQYNVPPGGTGNEANPDAFVICAAPTPAPTAATPAPTAAVPTTQISATGDPHMTTISGARFDIMRAGTHALLHIPQGAALADALLRVQVAVARQGSKCEDMYIKVLNVTGSWAEEKHVGGFSFVAESPAGGQVIAAPAGSADWSRLGMVDLKVVRGATRSGVLYLNMFARHLRDASRAYPIGGILGLDDHGEAATPAAECGKKVLSLLDSAQGLGALDGRSVADATIKTDPDAVLMPNRVRLKTMDRDIDGTRELVYFANCNRFKDNPDFPMMYGAVEVLSREAATLYLEEGYKCMSLPYSDWGEDVYLATCLREVLGVKRVFEPTIVGDSRCEGGACWDHAFAAYHEYKSVDLWFGCWNQTRGSF
ncbi:unnamed protein product, partial [Prorocentrum cordatum]